MITVKLKGGLGNQMFQYAFGMALSLRSSKKTKIDLTALLHRLPGREYVFRNFDLDIFNVSMEFTLLSKMAMLGHSFNNLAFILQMVFNWFNSKFRPGNFFEENENYFFNADMMVKASGFFDGYWQSYKYFNECADNIRQIFDLSGIAGDHSLDERITGTNAVCLNVRRTDYISNGLNVDFFGSLKADYYRQSVDIIKEKVNNPVFFIFSDDINWCKDNFDFIDDKIFVGDGFAGKKFGNYLRLMALCKHFIIPNSTFAWWAAWLSKNHSKIVIAPRQWVKNEKLNNNTKDLIPENWIRI